MDFMSNFAHDCFPNMKLRIGSALHRAGDQHHFLISLVCKVGAQKSQLPFENLGSSA